MPLSGFLGNSLACASLLSENGSVSLGPTLTVVDGLYRAEAASLDWCALPSSESNFLAKLTCDHSLVLPRSSTLFALREGFSSVLLRVSQELPGCRVALVPLRWSVPDPEASPMQRSPDLLCRRMEETDFLRLTKHVVFEYSAVALP